MNDAWSLVVEWSTRIGAPATAAELTAWLAVPFDEVGTMVRGRPRDGRVQWLQASVQSGQLRSAHLQLAQPAPLDELVVRLGPGKRYWAVDASSERVAWTMDAITVTAQLSLDGLVTAIDIAG
ncbi:hypothetical protein [Mycolicibacterium brisbanense]